MHIVHLALGVDAVGSVLMDIIDHPSGLVEGQSRDQKLATLWENYKTWAEASSPSNLFKSRLWVLFFSFKIEGIGFTITSQTTLYSWT